MTELANPAFVGPRIRILCVENHRVVQEGLELIIGRQPDMKFVGSAVSTDEAVSQFRELRPDVTLMDLLIGSTSGFEAIRVIRREDPNARIIVLTMLQGEEDMYRAFQEGAAAYLLKETITEELVRVIREVHAGKQVISRNVATGLAERASRPALT
jgi:DNA-binding NarL/FixJ family response regulator